MGKRKLLTLFVLDYDLCTVCHVFFALPLDINGRFPRFPPTILYKSIAGRYRPVSYPDGPITARYRFIKNDSWVIFCDCGSTWTS